MPTSAARAARGTCGAPTSGSRRWPGSRCGRCRASSAPATRRQAPRAFFDLSAALLAIALVVAVARWFRRRPATLLGRRAPRPWRLCSSPRDCSTYGLLGVALVAVALLAWSRGPALAAGLLLGAGVCAAPAAAILVVPVLALGLRARAARPALVFAMAAVAVWVGVRLLVYPDLDAGIPDTWAALA